MVTDRCDQCGGQVVGGSCADHFATLLALDHSREEPWGSRHGLAFAAFSLQHSGGAADSAIERWWQMLRRVYELGEDRQYVARTLRSAPEDPRHDGRSPLLPPASARPRHFAVTVADMGDFAPDRYAADLDAWCRATLVEWNRASEMDTH